MIGYGADHKRANGEIGAFKEVFKRASLCSGGFFHPVVYEYGAYEQDYHYKAEDDIGHRLCFQRFSSLFILHPHLLSAAAIPPANCRPSRFASPQEAEASELGWESALPPASA